MIDLPSLEVYISIFNKNPTNIKSELFTNTFDKLSFAELKDELKEILNISDINSYHLQHEIIGPRIIETYQKLHSEKVSTDGYIILLLGYARPPMRDFEGFFRIVVGLDEYDIQLILKQYSSNYVTWIRSRHSHKIFKKLFILLVIMKEPYKLNMMILTWKQNLFWLVLVAHLGLWDLMKNLF